MGQAKGRDMTDATKTCPICGASVPYGVSLIAIPDCPFIKQHRCKQSTMNRIDAALQSEGCVDRQRSYGERLERGFKIMGGR